MEEIIIKSIEAKPTQKGDLHIVNYNGNRKATIAPWEKDIYEYVSKFVNGRVSVEIETKNGYTNIVACDFNSGVTNNDNIPQPTAQGSFVAPKGMMSERDIMIVAQCLTKCVWYGRNDGNADMVLETYKNFLEKLE